MEEAILIFNCAKKNIDISLKIYQYLFAMCGRHGNGQLATKIAIELSKHEITGFKIGTNETMLIDIIMAIINSLDDSLLPQLRHYYKNYQVHCVKNGWKPNKVMLEEMILTFRLVQSFQS